MRLCSLFTSIGFAIALSGCGQSAPPTAPVSQQLAPSLFARTFAVTSTPPKIAGTYTGTVDDEHNGAGTLTVVVDQTGNKIGGTVTPDWNGKTNTFTFSGKVYVKAGKTKVNLSFPGPGEDCTTTAKGYVTKEMHFNGSYVTTGCASSGDDSKGTFKTQT
jgi:hypothetical protein